MSIVAGEGTARWLPGGAARAMLSGGNGLLPGWPDAALLAAYAVVGAVVPPA